jgi:ribosomal protein S18 acetylase RimI-like enzyme
MVAHGRIYYPADLPGFVALVDGEPTGLLTFEIVGTECEVVLIDSGTKGAGIGSALIDAVKHMARDAGCARLWLVTTNDNLDALRFYQRRSFVLCALRPDAIKDSRRLKPEIPLTGDFGIPLRDELELEIELALGIDNETDPDTQFETQRPL